MLRYSQLDFCELVGPINQRTAESFPIAGELYGWCSSVAAEDLAPGSVGRAVFDAEARGDIPASHRPGHIIHQYLGAGVDTTIAAIGNIVALLLGASRPAGSWCARTPRWSLPRSTRCSGSGAPVHAWGRRVTRDVEIDGTVVPAGEQVAILFGAGNRDPRHYDNPDAFLVERNPIDHLTFGYGPHGCAGQGLARLRGPRHHRRAGPPGRAPRRGARRPGSQATSPGASTSSPSSKWCPA